jgi:hypothetical protein
LFTFPPHTKCGIYPLPVYCENFKQINFLNHQKYRNIFKKRARTGENRSITVQIMAYKLTEKTSKDDDYDKD